MRIVLLSALLTASLTQVSGQNRGGQSGPAMAPPPARMHSAPPAAPRPAAPRPVAPPSPVARPPYVAHPHQPRSIMVPYPVFVGGDFVGGDYGYAPEPSADDNYGSANPAPVGVVNQDFRPDAVNPTIVDFSNVPLPEPDSTTDANTDESGLKDDEPTIVLIALTDHTVVAAIAYWVDGNTVNWVSRDAKQNHMSLSLVDRVFSKQLNDERRVAFKLPPGK